MKGKFLWFVDEDFQRKQNAGEYKIPDTTAVAMIVAFFTAPLKFYLV